MKEQIEKLITNYEDKIKRLDINIKKLTDRIRAARKECKTTEEYWNVTADLATDRVKYNQEKQMLIQFKHDLKGILNS